jgi:F-type H+-transporting ATPase subunit a
VLLLLGTTLLLLWSRKKKVSMLVFVIVMTVLGVFGALQAADILAGVPVFAFGIPAVLSLYFDIFSAFVQALVFSLLSMVYIAGSCPEPEAE